MYEKLYEDNRLLLSVIARRYASLCERDRAVSVEDLVQSGFLGLIRAEETFDKDGKVGWKNHARWCVIREMRRALHIDGDGNVGINANTVSLDNPLLFDDPDSPPLVDFIADDNLPASDEALLEEELRDTVHKAVDSLSDPRQRQVVLMCAFEGRTMVEAGSAIGVTAGRALYLYNRAQSALARDSRLRALVDLDERTRFHAHKGLRRFLSDGTSVTEETALWRIDQKEKISRRFSTRS